MPQTFQKLIFLPFRIFDVLKFLPIRLIRLVKHFLIGIQFFVTQKRTFQPIYRSIFYWWWEFGMQLLDILGLAEWYECACDFTKSKTRPLTKKEKNLVFPIFGNTINYDRVRIDETAKIACKSGFLKYVSFYTINSWGTMRDDIFIHEMVHVWQYENLGAIYIPKALRVHFTGGTYNYGGIQFLKKAMAKEWTFLDFNFEQQGDIVADYFRIKNGWQPIWGEGCEDDLAVYEYFLEMLK